MDIKITTEVADPKALYLVEVLASGEAEGFTFALDRGVTGMSLVLTLKRGDEQVGKETLDLRPMIQSWVGGMIERASK